MSERDMNRFGGPDTKLPLPSHVQPLPNSKSVPALHHASNMSECAQCMEHSTNFTNPNPIESAYRHGQQQ